MNQVRQCVETYQPKFFLLVSEFNNPTGYSISLTYKQKLLQLAEAHDFYILEDDAYALLSYDEPPPPSIKSFDRHEHVIYVNSFSKILLPGLRIGYVILPLQLREQFLANRRAIDACGQPLTERALASYLRTGRLKDHLKRANGVYRQRRDALMQALADYMPPGVTWTHPAGGFSSWVKLPEDKLIEIYQASLEAGIGFTPGKGFCVYEKSRHLRLSFSMQPPGEIREIVRLLALIIREHLTGQTSHAS
jgi:DNA-binding transcriptional MocR family regulator